MHIRIVHIDKFSHLGYLICNLCVNHDLSHGCATPGGVHRQCKLHVASCAIFCGDV
jgi:hypothetical protein